MQFRRKSRVFRRVESLEFEFRHFEHVTGDVTYKSSSLNRGSYGPVLGAFVRGASGCS